MAAAKDKVLIIGGGIGGLAFAHGLKKNNIRFHVYERDWTRNFRAQGYRIRVGGPAINALRYLFNGETWHQFELTSAATNLGPIPEINAITAEFRQSIGGPGGPPNPADAPVKPYTVDRTILRQLLLRDLETADMSFGKSLVRYELSANNITAVFADGSTAEGGLLVGADGANSQVRRQRIPDQLIVDTGG